MLIPSCVFEDELITNHFRYLKWRSDQHLSKLYVFQLMDTGKILTAKKIAGFFRFRKPSIFRYLKFMVKLVKVGPDFCLSLR